MSVQLDRIKAEIEHRDNPAELTDAGNGDRFVHQHGSDVRFVPELGWMVWTGTHWMRDELKARKLMLRTARSIHAEAIERTDQKEQKEVADWARKSQQVQRLQGALWCAQPAIAARADDFDGEIMLLPVANGTLDLRTGELHAHRREHYCTRLAPVYFDSTATCPTWLSFVERVLPDDDVRAFVQRLSGYSLTGSTVEQVLSFLYGSGRNGKSVFLETLSAILGEYHTPTRIETLSSSRGGGIPNDVAALAGARLVSVSETPEGSRLNESLIKDLSGGDTITARFLRREFFQFRPQFKLWIRGNHKPRISGTDDGIWRRVVLVPFTVQIPPGDVDRDLPNKLMDELPGILNWALDGCLEWQRNGLNPPSAVTDAVNEYRSEMDVLGEFIRDRCVTSPNAKAPASDLYREYKRWCDDSGQQPLSNMRFGVALDERGFRNKKSGTVTWHGIGLEARECPQCAGEGCKWCRSNLTGGPDK